jgi:hypothetical protein
MQTEFRKLTRCLICGFAEVRTDEVVDRSPVFLAECPRCDHRWTESLPTLQPARVRPVRHAPFREVVTAA